MKVRISWQRISVLPVITCTALLLLVCMNVVQLLSYSKSVRAADGFVSRCGIHFCLNGNTYYFAGANTYDMFTYGDGSSTATQNDIETKFMDKAKIDAHMTALQQDHVTVLRLWMFSHENWHGFEASKGVYNEPEFELFDYIIQSAIAHGIKLLPSLENYWTAYGGIDTRLQWEGVANGDANRWRFFNQTTCPGCFTQYKNYVSYVLNHVNHYSGVAYKNEPAIFAWELMNEPRYQNATPNENTSGTTLRAWVDTMASSIKSIDSHHMVEVGLEGHGTAYGFGGDEGNPFVYIQQSPYVDFTSAHLYPTESWANLSLAQTESLIAHYINDSHNIVGKPFFMGEFDVKNVDRSAWWNGMMATVEKAGGDGDAFWWYETTNVDGEYGVMQGAPELAVFRQHSLNMQAKNGPPVPTGTSTPTPAPIAVVDDLNDFSKIYSHSPNLSFDGTNTEYFHNDPSRLDRTTTTAEWSVWKLAGMAQFKADTYFWPYQTVSDFQFFASGDNVTYVQVTPQVNNMGGNWTQIQYTLSLPTGTNYVKVVFPTDASNAWDPQISQVTYSNS